MKGGRRHGVVSPPEIGSEHSHAMEPEHQPTVLLTGATDGLGRATAHKLTAKGVRLIVHGRSEDRIAATVAELVTEHGVDPPATVRGDFSSLAEVARVAAEVRGRTDRLDVLVNNVGIGRGDGERELTVDGYEQRWVVNYLSAFLLSLELVDLLRSSAPARIITVGSARELAIRFDDLMLERDYDAAVAYGHSKRALATFTIELAVRLSGSGVTANLVHPGFALPTKPVLANGVSPIDVLETGVEALSRQVLDPELERVTGGWFRGLDRRDPDPEATDPRHRRMLWDRSIELVGDHLTATPL
jgi:NAD(P)-dependent dehydrogenase (short-subunit alcohol dehydrogenase family)